MSSEGPSAVLVRSSLDFSGTLLMKILPLKGIN